jgi:hypothetical protein
MLPQGFKGLKLSAMGIMCCKHSHISNIPFLKNTTLKLAIPKLFIQTLVYITGNKVISTLKTSQSVLLRVIIAVCCEIRR